MRSFWFVLGTAVFSHSLTKKEREREREREKERIVVRKLRSLKLHSLLFSISFFFFSISSASSQFYHASAKSTYHLVGFFKSHFSSFLSSSSSSFLSSSSFTLLVFALFFFFPHPTAATDVTCFSYSTALFD